jgi:hypothetical protein
VRADTAFANQTRETAKPAPFIFPDPTSSLAHC